MEINSLEDLVKNPPKFESKPFHESAGPGTITWFFKPDDCWAEWVNHDLTVYYSRETKKIIGIQVNDKILDTERMPKPERRPRPSK